MHNSSVSRHFSRPDGLHNPLLRTGTGTEAAVHSRTAAITSTEARHWDIAFHVFLAELLRGEKGETFRWKWKRGPIMNRGDGLFQRADRTADKRRLDGILSQAVSKKQESIRSKHKMNQTRTTSWMLSLTSSVQRSVRETTGETADSPALPPRRSEFVGDYFWRISNEHASIASNEKSMQIFQCGVNSRRCSEDPFKYFRYETYTYSMYITKYCICILLVDEDSLRGEFIRKIHQVQWFEQLEVGGRQNCRSPLKITLNQVDIEWDFWKKNFRIVTLFAVFSIEDECRLNYDFEKLKSMKSQMKLQLLILEWVKLSMNMFITFTEDECGIQMTRENTLRSTLFLFLFVSSVFLISSRFQR